MKLKNLQLVNYRNYDKLYIEFNDRINLLLGSNGQGKTNIAESIYLLAFGKSFRTNRDRELIKFNTENLYVGGGYEKNGRNGMVEIAISKAKKGIKVNKIPIVKLAELLGNINVVIFSPEDLRLVKDGPKIRRSFIDREISQIVPGYYGLLTDYNKILANRNKLLKNMNPDLNLLDVYDESLADYGSKIFMFRKKFIERIAEISKDMHARLTDNKEDLNVIYKSQIQINDESSVKDKFINILKDKRKHDLDMRISGYGIHKDDILIQINGLDVRLYGSQGQQRTASISLKLSEIELINREVGEYPLLILDDVFSELDEKRQKLLVDNLKDVQMFITTAEYLHKNVLDMNNTTVFYIDNGKVVKTENGGN